MAAQTLAPGIAIQRASVFSYLLMFGFYILCHYLIVREYNRVNELVKLGNNDIEMLKRLKIFKFFSRWFPAFYVVFIIIILM